MMNEHILIDVADGILSSDYRDEILADRDSVWDYAMHGMGFNLTDRQCAHILEQARIWLVKATTSPTQGDVSKNWGMLKSALGGEWAANAT